MSTDAGRLWGPKDLADRWACTIATAMDRVRTKAVPYIWLGPGEAKLSGRGAKFVRFRPKAIEQWEASQEGYWSEAAKGEGKPRVVLAGGLLRGQKARKAGA